MKEIELQKFLYKILSEKDFFAYVDYSESAPARQGMHEFSMRELMIFRYREYISSILRGLEFGEYEIIGNVNPTNISLDKSHRLYPDILLCDEANRFYIFELKIGGKTEREAVTELYAYAAELLTHLPFTNASEVSLVIVADTYGTLLNHAVLQIISMYGLKILCLQVKYTSFSIRFGIYNPILGNSARAIELSEKSFSTLCLSLEQREEISLVANDNINWIYGTAEDLILQRANLLNSNGFLSLHQNLDMQNETGCCASYFIMISMINPYQMIDQDGITARGSNLAKFISNKRHEWEYHLQDHFFKIIEDGIKFLEKFYFIAIESSLTFEQFNRDYNCNSNVRCIRWNSWGEFGVHLKQKVYQDYSGRDIFSTEQDHKNPFTMFEVLEAVLKPNHREI